MSGKIYSKSRFGGLSRHCSLGNDSNTDDVLKKYDELEKLGEEYVEKAEEVDRVLDYINDNPAVDSETREKYLEILKKQRTEMNTQYIDGVQLQREILDEQMESIANENIEQRDENNKIASDLGNITSSEVNLDGVNQAQKEATEAAKEKDAIAEEIRKEVSVRQQFAQAQARKMRIDKIR